jgi:hypothetical protein
MEGFGGKQGLQPVTTSHYLFAMWLAEQRMLGLAPFVVEGGIEEDQVQPVLLGNRQGSAEAIRQEKVVGVDKGQIPALSSFQSAVSGFGSPASLVEADRAQCRAVPG